MEVRRGDPSAFYSIYMGDPSSREGSVFLLEDMKFYNPPPNLSSGILNPDIQNFVSSGQFIVQAWDTAFSDKKEADFSVGLTGLLVSCDIYHRNEDPELLGPCEPHYDLYLLDMVREQYKFTDLTLGIKTYAMKWRPRFVLIEDKASGISAIQVLQTSGINVEGVKSVEGKRARATTIVGTGSAQGWMKLHRVLIPAGEEWVDRFIQELRNFTGDGSGFDDVVDSLVTAIIYTIKQSTNGTVKMSGGVLPRSDEEIKLATQDILILGNNRHIDLTFQNAFETMCGKCNHRIDGFCKIVNKRVASIESCDSFEGKYNPLETRLWI